MDIKVYYDLLSQPSRAIVLLLKANKIPYTECPVSLKDGQHHTEEFSAINPFKRVPAIQHHGFSLSESIAIARYIAREFVIDDWWYPADSRRRALVDRYLEWQHLNIRFFGFCYFRAAFLDPVVFKKETDQRRIDNFSRGLDGALDTIEEVFLKDHPFVAGEKISVADLFAVCEIEQPKSVGYDVTRGRPKLAQWMERVRNHLQPEYDQVHKQIHTVRQIFAHL